MARLRFETTPEITVNDESAVFKAAAGATAPLVEFKNSSGTVVATIAANGNLTATDLNLAGNLVVTGATTSPSTAAAIDLKSNIASPTFTGVPTAPTAAAATNTTQIATTAFVTGAVTDLIGGAPGALNTLNELAEAINDDASYAAGITTALGLKAPLASPTFTGTPTLPTGTIAVTQTANNNSTAVATTAYVDAAATAAAVLDLDDLSDVTITAAADKDFLMYNGTAWVDQPITLGTDTTGNYMSGVSQGTGITVTHSPGEGSTATIAVDNTIATLASPALTGTPTAPTAAVGTSTTQIATTAFVMANAENDQFILAGQVF